MALEIFWGSGSPPAWIALLTLEYKGLPYKSHRLEFSKKEHKSPEMMKMNPRGKVPVLKDGDFVVYESQAIAQYLDKKYPQKPLYGTTPEETANIIRTISEFTSYLQKPMGDTVRPFLMGQVDYNVEEMHKAAEITHVELKDFNERLKKTPYLCGNAISAADLTFYPSCKLFIRGNEKEEAKKHKFGFLPFEEKFGAIAKWMKKIEAIPGYDKTFPPHWKE